MFVAIQTENRDGHDFLENARAAGAVAALVSRETSLVDLPQLVVSDTEKALRELAIQ
ncbi:MAG: UDP-N-acetylmuramoyl-tripeptide--D-alanyl-D-alanine ligase, partial [Verrucomicrobiae bacterium]|nr:UDP-N-acetylmuramoyl-tripeptide--D-alanyl-D-alanine ligase [Verrucomicrobiae bacterium]